MFRQDLHLAIVFDDRDAASLTIIENFAMIMPFALPYGIYHGGIAFDLHRQRFSFHALKRVDTRSGRDQEAGSVKRTAGLSVVNVM